MQTPRIWNHAKYRIVDQGGSDGLHVEQRSHDALGAEKFDSAMRVKGNWITIPWSVFVALWREASEKDPAVEPRQDAPQAELQPESIDEQVLREERRRLNAERIQRNRRLGLATSA